MTSLQDRWLRIVTALNNGDGTQPSPQHMCSVAADLLAAGGTGLLVMAQTPQGTAFASNALAATLENLEFAVGVGPGLDAHRLGAPVSESDLSAPAGERWVGYCEAAVEAGARSVIAFPLRIGAARIGAFTVYNTHAGALDDEVNADAVVLAGVLAHAILAAQAGPASGALAGSLDEDSLFDATVHQAAGMVSVQLGVDVAEALVRLRARAFADGVKLAALAAEVVARHFRLDGR
ncbi:MAG: GAF domain protein [Acidimicrobiales bacterium]